MAGETLVIKSYAVQCFVHITINYKFSLCALLLYIYSMGTYVYNYTLALYYM